MKLVIGVVVVAMALGMWAGFRASESASVMAQVDRAFAVFITLQFIASLWMWYRAPGGSGDAMVAPTLVMVSGAMLLGVLPRALWPESDAIRHAGTVASSALLLTLVVVHVRRQRLRRSTDGR